MKKYYSQAQNYPTNFIEVGVKDNMLSDLVTIWFDYICQRYAPKTVIQYKLVLRQFLVSMPPEIRMSEITPSHILNYITYLLETQHSNRTCNDYLIAIRSFYHWAKDNYDIKNPVAKIRNLRELPPKQRVLTLFEYQTILKIAKGVDNAAIQFLANTGLRRNEFRFLCWSDFISDFVHIRGKHNKCRVVPLNQTCKQLLAQYPQNGELRPRFVQKFTSQREKLYRLCQSLANKANISPFGPHALRHFFATQLIRAGVPLIKVSKILGHANTLITQQIYVHLVPQDLAGVTDCLELL